MSTTNEVKERPILFSAPMVRAILAGKKTQTRRALKRQPHYSKDHKCWMLPCGQCKYLMNRHREDVFDKTTGALLKSKVYELPMNEWLLSKSPFSVGDHLWVRESLIAKDCANGRKIAYAADGLFTLKEAIDIEINGCSSHQEAPNWKWRNASLTSIHMPRVFSRITLEVTGVSVERLGDIDRHDACAEGIRKAGNPNPVASFRALWESINGDGSWARNPFVWAITFRRIEP